MRTILLCLFMFLTSIACYSQINFEHTYTNPSYTYNINTNNQTMYCNFNPITNVLTLYNNDHSLYKSITITPPAGYQINTASSVQYASISTKVFNTDDLVEFAFTFLSTGTPSVWHMFLYNENLQIIKDFGDNRSSVSLFKTVNNETKCMVTGVTINGSQYTYYQDIYHLPGNLPVDVAILTSTSEEQSPFPNPTNTYIIIPFSIKMSETAILNIFNQQGQIIDSKIITGNETSLRYDVQSLNPGLYFYQYNNVKAKFIVSK